MKLAAARPGVATLAGCGGSSRQVAFFDAPDLALDKARVIVRARRIQGAAAIR